MLQQKQLKTEARRVHDLKPGDFINTAKGGEPIWREVAEVLPCTDGERFVIAVRAGNDTELLHQGHSFGMWTAFIVRLP